MKKNLTILLFLLGLLKISAQSFEGEIIYQLNYKSKVPSISDEQFNEMMGTTQNYFFKEGNYKALMNGTGMEWQLYNNAENKLYNKLADSNMAYWIDASKEGNTIQEVLINKKALKILGYECDEVIFVCKNGNEKYYFNSELSIDISLFENHALGHWFDYLKISGALPMMAYIETPECIIKSTAVKIDPKKLNSDIFKIPEGVMTEKSPF